MVVNTCRAWSPAPTCPQAPLVLTAQEFYSHSHQCCPLPLKMPDRNDVKGEHGVEGHDVEASYLCDLGFSCGVWNVQGFPDARPQQALLVVERPRESLRAHRCSGGWHRAVGSSAAEGALSSSWQPDAWFWAALGK